MKKSVVVILFGLVMINLIGFVYAEEFNSCSQNSDCKVDICNQNSCVNQSYTIPDCTAHDFVAKECKCTNNICTVSIGSAMPICDADHPGKAYCKDEKTLMVCESSWISKNCDYKCENGACISQSQTIRCSKDEDCGAVYTKEYCSENSACTATITPICLNPGTVNSLCSSNSVPACVLCSNACREGGCVEAETSIPTPISCPSPGLRCRDGSISPCKIIDNKCECAPCPVPQPEQTPLQKCAAKIKITLDKEIYYYGDSIEIRIEVFDSQGNRLPDYPIHYEFYVYQEGRWYPMQKDKTDENGYKIFKGVIEEGRMTAGKSKHKVYTPDYVNCKSVEDNVEVELKKAVKEEICGIGVCMPKEEKIKKIENISEEKKEKMFYSCSGCNLDDKCYPLGYRREGEYCSIDYKFVIQREEGSCNNNFECKSNVCVSGECIGENLMKKIINWFKKLFGQKELEKSEETSELCSKLLIEKNIEDYKYNQSGYGGSKNEQAPLYSKDGKQIGVVKCCGASYDKGMAALVCPYDNKEELYYSVKGLSARGEIYLGEYNGEKIYTLTGKKVIVWINNNYIVAVGTKSASLLPENIINAYLKKYPNDLSEFLEKIKQTPVEAIPVKEAIKEPSIQPPSKITEELLNKIKEIGDVTLVDFETLPNGNALADGTKLTGKEWESLGVLFETPSEEYLKVFGEKYPFNPIDKLSLSPGFGPFEDGSDTDDDLNIIFTKPVKVAGFYILDLGETDERESITFFDENGKIIEKISPFPQSTFGNPAPGTFVSLIHEGISKIEILENTKDSDDIAYDNLYFVR